MALKTVLDETASGGDRELQSFYGQRIPQVNLCQGLSKENPTTLPLRPSRCAAHVWWLN